jgi:excisionase family DNA binding protein
VSDDRLSPSQAAAYIAREWYLKVHPGTVRRWATKGGLSATRDERGRVLIDPADLHAIFDIERKNATTQHEAHESNDCNICNSWYVSSVSSIEAKNGASAAATGGSWASTI